MIRQTFTFLSLAASPLAAENPYGHFLEPGFPFVESTVDARGFGTPPSTDNLSPRAVVLRLGADTYAAFDTDLLRLTASWHGGFLEPNTIAMRSYQEPRSKMGAGQNQLCRPVGQPLTTTGLFPGWHVGTQDFSDPRPTTPDPRELGRGPLPGAGTSYIATQVHGASATLHYRVAGYAVNETITGAEGGITRHVHIAGGREQPLHLYLGDAPASFHLQLTAGTATLTESENHRLVTVPAGSPPVGFSVSTSPTPAPLPERTLSSHWPELLTTSVEAGDEIDQIALPAPNPWRRNVRPSGITFDRDGIAYICTYDGDVYKVANLRSHHQDVTWQRIASGFNEPNSLAVHGGHVHVFSRGGLTKLVDTDGNGETDRYELVSNNFTQSAETRDYAHDMAVSPDGTFHLVKGGQQTTYRARHSGRLLDISGSSAGTSVHATGFRNAYIGLDPESGKIYACDQQGNWVPTTPVYEVVRGGYYGFNPSRPLAQPEPLPEHPLVWLPHRTCQSAVDIVPVPVKNELTVVDYFRPGVVRVLLPSVAQPHAAAIPLALPFTTPLLKGALNPKDGCVYLVGFQVWGSIAKDLAGFCRYHPNAVARAKPIIASPYKNGVHLRFAEPLDPDTATDPARYSITSWNYQRSKNYGSGHFKSDGSGGTDSHVVHTVLLNSENDDGQRAVFLATPTLNAADTIEVTYDLPGNRGSVYFSPGSLTGFELGGAFFPEADFARLFASPPAPRSAPDPATDTTPTVARGKHLHTVTGCIACHSDDGSTEGKAGPSWKGLYGTQRKFTDGSSVRATDAYLRQSILDPAVRVNAGFNPEDVGMPSYRGILSDADIDSLILYIRSLK